MRTFPRLYPLPWTLFACTVNQIHVNELGILRIDTFMLCLGHIQLVSSSLILLVIHYFSLPTILNLLLWYHWVIVIFIRYMYHRKWNQYFNQSDCKVTNDTHIDSYNNDIDKRQGMVGIITIYINQVHMRVHTWNWTNYLCSSTTSIYYLQNIYNK